MGKNKRYDWKLKKKMQAHPVSPGSEEKSISQSESEKGFVSLTSFETIEERKVSSYETSSKTQSTPKELTDFLS